jgi:hypothetical protein
MAFEFSNYAVKHTFKAGEDLSAKQYHFVKIDAGDGSVVAVDGATDRPVGVLQNDPRAGEAAEVLITGGTKIECGGSASFGQPLFSSAAGKGVTLAFGTTASAAFNVGTFIENGSASAIAAAVINCSSATRGL